MKKNTKFISSVLILFFLGLGACKEEEYEFGDLTPPTNIQIEAILEGQNEANPYGDGSGNVTIKITADKALSYKVDFGDKSAINFVHLPSGTSTKKYVTLGVNTYRITALVFGVGGTSSTLTKDIIVKSDFVPDPTLVANLTGAGTKTWAVDPSVAGHFGVGPWEGAVTPIWWQAGINEKVGCCNCFYTANFKFTKTGSTFSLQVTTPDGAFTKTGSLTKLPGIPGSGSEGCYAYGGATGEFTFGPATTGIPASTPSTLTSINLSSDNLFIGYGSVQSEYEILTITPTTMYLRVRGLETGNSWYLKLIAL